MNYLLDTCVLSEYTSKQPNQQIIDQIDAIEEIRLFLSVITIGEIQQGIERLPDSKRKNHLHTWLYDALLSRFQDRILPITTDVMLAWGELTSKRRTLPAMDSLIAAIAISYQVCLITRNVKDFEGFGLSIFNPWDDIQE